jgi:hypothetical protein
MSPTTPLVAELAGPSVAAPHKNIFGIFEASMSERRILLAVELVAQAEVRCEAPSKVRTAFGSRRRPNKYRSVADIESSERIARLRIARLLEVVGGLRKRSDVVLGDQAVGSVVGPSTIAAR